LLRGFAIWVPVYCVGSAVSSYLNALGIVRFQAVTVGLMVAANVPLSIILVRAWGVSGAIYGSVISYAIFVLVPCAYYLPHQLHNLASEPRDPLDSVAATSQTSSNLLP
jgi:Na+-driven multidrug efflux pump